MTMALEISKTLDKPKQHKFWSQYCIVIIASLCFFNRGLHSAWPSPSLPLLLDKTINSSTDIFGESITPHHFSINTNQASWVVVIYMGSISIGAPIGSIMMQCWGRKSTILFSAIPSLLGFMIIAFAPSLSYLYVARFLGGFTEGICNIALPAYVGEIAHPEVRGRLGCITSLMIISGLLTINIIGSFFSITQTAMICCIFPIILLLTFSWLPESPYYLIMKNHTNKAEKALCTLRATKQIQNELKTIETAVEKQMLNRGSFRDLFCNQAYRQALIITCMLEVIQQASGISAIQSYTQVIFIESKQSISYQLSAILLMFTQGCVGILGTNLVDRLGRKPLLVLSCIGCGFCLILEGLYFFLQYLESPCLSELEWLPLTAMTLYIAVYSMGLAIVLNVILSEVFAANVKGKAMGVISIWYGILAFAFSRSFQILIDWAGLFLPFWIFALCCFLGAIYIYLYIPETKGKTLDEIQDYFNRRRSTIK